MLLNLVFLKDYFKDYFFLCNPKNLNYFQFLNRSQCHFLIHISQYIIDFTAI